MLPKYSCPHSRKQEGVGEGGAGRQGTYFSFRVFATDSSMLRCDAGQSEVVTASRAYICSFFFRIWSYCALRW